MFKKTVSLLLAVLLLVALAPMALAADLPDFNETRVFIKQERSTGTCTLASAAMMLRRAALLSGDASWDQITEASCRPVFWRGGLPYSFTYGSFTVGHARLPGGAANRAVLADVLAKHPEGIVLHSYSARHGILLTDYTDGVFYCADPAPSIPSGRITIDQAWGTRIENSSAYWYITSPIQVRQPTLVASSPQPEVASDAILSVSEHLGLPGDELGTLLDNGL